MTRIVWNPENLQITGEVGSLRYVIREPSLTPGWRVWVHLNENGSSVGGTIVTMKAPDLEAAKYAAECHLRKFVATLLGDPSGYTDSDELRDLKQSILQCRSYIDFLTVRKTVEAIAALTPTQPDNPGA